MRTAYLQMCDYIKDKEGDKYKFYLNFDNYESAKLNIDLFKTDALGRYGSSLLSYTRENERLDYPVIYCIKALEMKDRKWITQHKYLHNLKKFLKGKGCKNFSPPTWKILMGIIANYRLALAMGCQSIYTKFDWDLDCYFVASTAYDSVVKEFLRLGLIVKSRPIHRHAVVYTLTNDFSEELLELDKFGINAEWALKFYNKIKLPQSKKYAEEKLKISLLNEKLIDVELFVNSILMPKMVVKAFHEDGYYSYKQETNIDKCLSKINIGKILANGKPVFYTDENVGRYENYLVVPWNENKLKFCIIEKK